MMHPILIMIGLLRTPIAQRKGVIFTPEECLVWAEELKKYDELPKDAIVIEGVCSDKDFIDTNHGILAFGAEEGSYRPFNDGDKVKITITKE